MSCHLLESAFPVDLNNLSTHKSYQEWIIQNFRKHFIVRTNIKAQKYISFFKQKSLK